MTSHWESLKALSCDSMHGLCGGQCDRAVKTQVWDTGGSGFESTRQNCLHM